MPKSNPNSNNIKLTNNSRIVIYGAGSEAMVVSALVKDFLPNSQILFYVDSFRDGTFNNKKLIKFDDFKNSEEKFDVVIIASAFYEEIEKNLKSIGVNNYLISKKNLKLRGNYVLPHDLRSTRRKQDTVSTYIKRDCCPVCYGVNAEKTDYDDIF